MRQGHFLATASLAALFNLAGWVLVDAPPAEGPVVAPTANGAPTAPSPVAGTFSLTSNTVRTDRVRTDRVPVGAAVTSEMAARSEKTVRAAFFTDINTVRAGVGLVALAPDPKLDALALSWAVDMADDAELRHSELIYDIVRGEWTAAGENIAFGPTEESIFAGLDASETHRGNMINARYTHAGVGVVIDGPVIWTVHLFAG